MIGKTWRDTWEHVIPFLASHRRQACCLHDKHDRSLAPADPQSDQGPRTLPHEEAARKLIYLSIINAQKRWRQAFNWSAALLSFKIHFGNRLP